MPPIQGDDLEYIKMNDQQFGAMCWMLPWGEHRRLDRLRNHWRNTWLDITNITTTGADRA